MHLFKVGHNAPSVDSTILQSRHRRDAYNMIEGIDFANRSETRGANGCIQLIRLHDRDIKGRPFLLQVKSQR